MQVELLDHCGSDLDVVNAARVSFDKESEFEQGIDEEGFYVETLKNKDIKLIAYLAANNHWSPFAHCYVKFRVTAPIAIARQLQKHTVGLAWNEVSRRYVNYTPDVYVPDEWRSSSSDKKQGSGDVLEGVTADSLGYNDAVDVAVSCYERMLAAGVCEEQARFVLPQGAVTTWIWSGSLYAFARVVRLRSSSDAQKESQMIAAQIETYLKTLFPVSAAALIR